MNYLVSFNNFLYYHLDVDWHLGKRLVHGERKIKIEQRLKLVLQQKSVLIPAGPFIMGSPGRPVAEGAGN